MVSGIKFGGKATVAALLCAMAAGCATTPSGLISGPATPSGQGGVTPPVSQPNTPPTRGQEGLTPPFMASRDIVRVGLLLPFRSRPEDANAVYQAAELGVFDFGNSNTLLIPRESGATPEEAEAAARLLLRDGVDVILGPIARESVAGAARAAKTQNVPVIGFSSDRLAAGDGVYILSFPLEEEVSRIVAFAASRNIRSIALLAPDNDYGRRVADTLRAEMAGRNAVAPMVQLYARTNTDAAAAARAFAPRAKAAGVQAVLIAESGGLLRAIGPALLAGGLNLDAVKLMGTGVWAGGDAQRDPTLAKGWYAGPNPNARTKFVERYRAAYAGREPSRAASQAYDAMYVATQVTRGGPNGLTRSALERVDGFSGADGLFRFRRDGTIQRSLSILEVRPTGPVVVENGPNSFSGS
jgi:ABC-type branched-subunit amino acid transport system substrate-binding protein